MVFFHFQNTDCIFTKKGCLKNLFPRFSLKMILLNFIVCTSLKVSLRFFIKNGAFEFLAFAVIRNQYRVTSLLIWLQLVVLVVTNTELSFPSFRVNLEI